MRVDRAGSTPWARANASGSPGSGGRHQQVGGPAACGQTRALDRPRDGAGQRATAGARASRAPSGPQSNTRCGASGSACAIARSPAGTLQRRGGDEHAGRRSRTATRERRRRCSTLANPSSADGGSSSRTARICDVGSEQARLAPRERPQLLGRRAARRTASSSRSTRLTCAWASGVSSQTHRAGTPCRRGRLDHVAARRAREVRVVEHDAAARPPTSASSSASASARSDPPRSSRLRRR